MEKHIQFNDLPVFYTVTGEGYPVVLLHGLAEDGSIWDGQTAFLSGAHRLIIPDLPGSGRSPLPADPHVVTMESMAGAVNSILTAEGIEEAVVIGHSMGGYVTLAFAELYPHMPKAIGLFHSTAYADSEEKKSARNKNMEFIGTHGTHEFLKHGTPALFSEDSQSTQPELVNALIVKYKDVNPLALVAYNHAMLQRADRSQLLLNASYPVLFIIGRHDGAIPFHQSLQLAHMPDIAYIHILEKSGHMGMLEEEDRSNRAMKKFLEDVHIY